MGAPEVVRYLFQPLVNMRVGGVLGVEAVPVVHPGGLPELYRTAERDGRLAEQDVRLAVGAVRAFSAFLSFLPLHVNILASTVVHDLARLDVLREEVRRAGRREHELTLEIGPPVPPVDTAALLDGVEHLRACGFRIALDEVGGPHTNLTLIADVRPDLVKLHPQVVQGLTERRGRLGVLEGMNRVCESAGAGVVVCGVDTEQQLGILRHHDIRLLQGDVLAKPAESPPRALTVPKAHGYVEVATGRPADATTGPRITEYLVAAATLPPDVTADEVRAVFAEHSEANGVVLVDEEGRPQYSLQRDRFLLAVTGPYGHALHARKPASRLADKPQIVTTTTTAMEALRLVMRSDRDRLHDDVVVVDEQGRCLGAVRSVDLIKGLAELRVDEAAQLNPLTHLPGSDSIAREVGRRIDRGENFAVGWLDIDRFKAVNDVAGFSAGDELIRQIARSLTDAATTLESVAVAHIGGDDFLMVAAPDELRTLAEMVLDPMRETKGVRISLSLATLECAPGSAASYQEVSRRLAGVKRFAKRLPGTSWAASHLDVGRIEVLRGPEPVAEYPAETTQGVLSGLGSGGETGGETAGLEHTRAPADAGQVPSTADRPRDVSALARLQRSSQRFTDLLSLAPVGIGLFDEAECLVDANAALCDLLGYELNELRGMTAGHLIHPQAQTEPDHGDAAHFWLSAPSLATNNRMLIRSDGTPVYCELHAALSVADDGTQFWLVVFQDITERQRVAEALHHRATHDDLTGLPNRTALGEMLEDLLADPEGPRVGALICDLDNFKRINDSLGHDAGDSVLTALATRLQSGVPAGCTVSRIAGDEFVVVCTDVDEAGGIDALATQVSSLFRSSVPVHGGQLVRLSAAIGAAVSDESGMTGADLLRHADAAKTDAKSRGAGHVARAGPVVRTSAGQQVELEGQLRTALASDGLTLFYQPIVDSSGWITGAEALLRWPRPDGTLVSPGMILPVAEQGGLLRELDRWVLRTALGQAATWPTRPDRYSPEVTVNVAELTSGDSGFIDEISQIIDESGIDWGRVVLEVVETALADLPPRPLAVMHELAGRGVRFAVDDFGTGYSSLARLRDLPAQIIKVERRFVAGVAKDRTDLAVGPANLENAPAW